MTDIDAIALPRDRAIAIGLVVNELCVNAAKHASPGRASGRIRVTLRASQEGTEVSVADNGVGMGLGPVRTGILGQGLIEAFAEPAGGTLEKVAAPIGTTFRLLIPPAEPAAA